MRSLHAAATTAGLLLSFSTVAAGLDQTKVDGFLSARYSVTDEAAYFQEDRANNGINEDGSFYGTKLGLNITAPVGHGVTVASQLISKIEENNYATHLDWAFINVPLAGNRLRAGKIKFPVGLVNEYVDVGVAYPWIEAPAVIYSESATGPQATREAYTGVSYLIEGYSDDLSYGVDLFGGQVDLSGMTIKSLVGATVRGNWNEQVDVQVSAYQGTMKPDPGVPMEAMMDGKTHQAVSFGAKAEIDSMLAMAEYAQVKMDSMNGMMDSDSWYVTLGYRMGRWLPHVTMQDWSQESGYGHAITTGGLNYSLSAKTVIKAELSQIQSDRWDSKSMMFTGAGVHAIGLFSTGNGEFLSSDTTQLFSVALETVF